MPFPSCRNLLQTRFALSLGALVRSSLRYKLSRTSTQQLAHDTTPRNSIHSSSLQGCGWNVRECSGRFEDVREYSGIFGKVRRSSKNIPVDGSRQARAELALLLLPLAELQRQSHSSTAFAKASVRLPLHRRYDSVREGHGS